MFSILALIVLQMAPLHASATLSSELIHDSVVLSFCRVLVRKAASERHWEQGAFLVRTTEGMLYFVAWPPSDDEDLVRWYGRYPDGTVAIVHTHQPWLPAPSKLDMTAARRARVPVYVITPYRISKTTGRAAEVVIDGDWMKERR